jgi:hypothetical protein
MAGNRRVNVPSGRPPGHAALAVIELLADELL